MNLYIRNATARPEKMLDALAFATEIATQVTTTTGLEVTPWSTVYGAPLGTLSWSARVASQAEIAKFGDQLLADAKYVETLEGAIELFAAPAEDTVSEIVTFAGSGGNAGEYAAVVVAQCADGRMADAMAWAVDIMNHVSSVTGQDVTLVRGLYGPFATLAWITMAETIEQVDAGTAAIAADSTYIDKIDSAADLFVPGATTSRLVRRLS